MITNKDLEILKGAPPQQISRWTLHFDNGAKYHSGESEQACYAGLMQKFVSWVSKEKDSEFTEFVIKPYWKAMNPEQMEAGKQAAFHIINSLKYTYDVRKFLPKDWARWVLGEKGSKDGCLRIVRHPDLSMVKVFFLACFYRLSWEFPALTSEILKEYRKAEEKPDFFFFCHHFACENVGVHYLNGHIPFNAIDPKKIFKNWEDCDIELAWNKPLNSLVPVIRKKSANFDEWGWGCGSIFRKTVKTTSDYELAERVKIRSYKTKLEDLPPKGAILF